METKQTSWKRFWKQGGKEVDRWEMREGEWKRTGNEASLPWKRSTSFQPLFDPSSFPSRALCRRSVCFVSIGISLGWKLETKQTPWKRSGNGGKRRPFPETRWKRRFSPWKRSGPFSGQKPPSSFPRPGASPSPLLRPLSQAARRGAGPRLEEGREMRHGLEAELHADLLHGVRRDL